MPLLDHFHPPLLGRRHWEGFHGWWAAQIADKLNENLPGEYFAEFQVRLGNQVEVDVGTPTERPPKPIAVLPAIFPDDFEVQIFSSVAGPVLVAAIELVSPRNKDRPEARRAFAAKCAAYLQRGIGLVIVDIATSRHANLHDELMTLLGHGEAYLFNEPTPLYATAYRPAHRQERNEIDLWRETLALAQPLPTLPLAVRGLGCLAVDLEGTYTAARKRGRIG
jgi:hypothetical protein